MPRDYSVLMWLSHRESPSGVKRTRLRGGSGETWNLSGINRRSLDGMQCFREFLDCYGRRKNNRRNVVYEFRKVFCTKHKKHYSVNIAEAKINRFMIYRFAGIKRNPNEEPQSWSTCPRKSSYSPQKLQHLLYPTNY